MIFLIGGLFKLFFRRCLPDHHDSNSELYAVKFGRRDLRYRLMPLCERLPYATADVAIATNESYRQLAIQRGRMPPDRVFVLRSGPSLDCRRIQPPEPRLKCGCRQLAGCVGVKGKHEGLHYLLRAAQHIILEWQRTDVDFGLVGSGSELENLRRLAVGLGIADDVTFTARVPDRELRVMRNTADVCMNAV